MFPTPDLSHLSRKDFENIYEPAEDTFILLDALEEDFDRFIKNPPSISVEIGSGSGCVSVFVQKILKSIPMIHFCTDINPLALKATAKTFYQNSLENPNLIQTSLLDCLRLDRSVDLLIFNPPYVETEEDEYGDAKSQADISASWAGGSSGMTLTNNLLNNLDKILSPLIGTLYLVAIKQNKPEDILQRMIYQGFKATIVLKRRAGREYLHVLRISRY